MDRRRWLVGTLTGLATIASLAGCSSMTEGAAPELEGGIGTSITDGRLDGDGHPFVGLMVANDADGNPMWRCSGTLPSPTLFLTAGHCTEAPAVTATIWFEADVQSIATYPYEGPTTVSGLTYTHPDFDTDAFFLADVGVVVLEEPMVRDEYGELPGLNVLDALRPRPGKPQVFTAVGYGLQRTNPVFTEGERVRMVATPHLLQINVPGFTGDFSMLLSNNASTGGTCFGASGGPNFLGDSNVVAGVTSFGINGNCAGTGGVFRMDRKNVLIFVRPFLGLPAID